MTQQTERLRAALVDRYRIERELGSGGMATVYLGEDRKHHRPVAVKVLRPELAAAIGPDRFLREIQITARLDHPHILPLLDSGEAEGFLFYVMPLVEGESLRDRLSREGQLPLDVALQLTREVADGLGYAHSHDVVHRDIKPENILLSGAHARIADFGIARAITAAGGASLTQTGMAIGTAEYMSPEQAAGDDRIDGRSDIYGLGCVLYEMLAGEPPFTGPNVQAVLARKSKDPAPRITTIRETVPHGIETAIVKALAKVPADRYPTAQQFADALAQGAPTAAGLHATRSKRRMMFSVVTVVLVLAIVSLVLSGKVSFGIRPAAAHFFNANDRVVVAAFDNETNQPALGLAVREAVVTDLDQSEYLDTVDHSALAPVLERMRLTDTTVVDTEVALEIARREGYPAVVAGGVTSVGAGYQLTVRIIEASTGEVAIRLRETAGDDGEVVSALERLVRLARRHLGESLRSLRRSDPLPQVTTASLEALQLSARATELGQRGEYVSAIPLLEQAVALDTAFAAAHRALGIYYGNIGHVGAAQRNIDLAYRYSHRLHPRERYLIRSTYNSYRNRLDSAAFYYERLLDRHPDDQTAVNNLGDLYERMGRYEPALRLYRRAVEIKTSSASLVNVASAARTLGQHPLADSAEALMVERFRDVWPTWFTQHQNALYAGDEIRQERIADEMSDSDFPFPRGFGRHSRAGLRAMHGQLGAALALADSAIDPILEFGSQFAAYRPLATATWAAFAADVPERALPFIERVPDPTALEGAPRFRYLALGLIAQVLALSGRVDETRSLLGPMDSIVAAHDFRPYGLGEHLQAIVALQEGRAEQSLEHLRRAQADDFGHLNHPSRLLLGETYVALGRLKEAAAQYDTLANTYGLNFNDVAAYQPLRPIAHERAASIYLALGDTATAVTHLAPFIELWKDADPTLQPRVRDARQRLARLVGEPR